MKQEEYPEKIYAYRDITYDGWTETGHENSDECEYIRADLVENLLDKEFKRGVIEGERIAANDEWHKYPNEKPIKDQLYIVQDLFDGTFIAYNHGTDEWYDNLTGMLLDDIVAFQELPKPFKED